METGELIYPQFDGFWKHNQKLGSPAWRPIILTPVEDERKPGTHLVRVSRPTGSSGTAIFDPRMLGKVQAHQGRGGRVVFIKNLDLEKHTANYDTDDGIGGRLQARALLLDPPDDIWVLKVLVVANNYAIAEPVKIDKLP